MRDDATAMNAATMIAAVMNASAMNTAGMNSSTMNGATVFSFVFLAAPCACCFLVCEFSAVLDVADVLAERRRRSRGAPRGKKQQRRKHLFTEHVVTLVNKAAGKRYRLEKQFRFALAACVSSSVHFVACALSCCCRSISAAWIYI